MPILLSYFSDKNITLFRVAVILFCYYLAITFDHAILVDQLADGVGFYISRAGIFDGVDVSDDVCADVGILKREVGALHSAVNKRQILTVAEGLCAYDMTVFKCQSFGKPSKILSLEGGIFNGYIFTVPECVLGVKVAILDSESVYVLK